MARRGIDLIVIHCSATRTDRCFTEHDPEAAHHCRGFNGCGYHFYIRRNGDIRTMHPVGRVRAHARGYNARSIGICYEGGLDEKGRPVDTRTGRQHHSLHALVRTLLLDHPGYCICRHRDLSPDLNGSGEVKSEEWVEQCPCFEVSKEQW